MASLFIHLADTDDPYYLNRSVWVAEHGNAATLDTMFTPEVLNSPYGGGVPIASIESLLGVIAHMTGLRAGTVTYLVATPVVHRALGLGHLAAGPALGAPPCRAGCWSSRSRS